MTTRPAPPPRLPGFEHIPRFWDRRRQRFGAKIGPGEFYVTRSDELLSTVLGSCVAACVHDCVGGVGGINHFMLPKGGPDLGEGLASEANRFGNFAMESLINEVLKSGGRRDRIEVKIFGGARILVSGTDVGRSNVEFVERYLADERLRVTAEDLGGESPRKLIYEPRTGRVWVRRMCAFRRDIEAHEKRYLEQLATLPGEGAIELFT
ncbi:MAG: chemoreceptor glutamine deamidase CheD [Planctomycetota bacterium]